MNISNMLRALERIYENRYGGKWTFTAQKRSGNENVENNFRCGSRNDGRPDSVLPS